MVGEELPYEIVVAYQRTALLLDEAGAEIESEAYMATEAAEAPPENVEEPQPKRLVFDRPFLLVMKRKEAEHSYFVAWIVNEELMKKRNS